MTVRSTLDVIFLKLLFNFEVHPHFPNKDASFFTASLDTEMLAHTSSIFILLISTLQSYFKKNAMKICHCCHCSGSVLAIIQKKF